MVSLLSEFDSQLVGVAVFADNAQEKREGISYKSLLTVTNIDVKESKVDVKLGNIFSK
jgi:purine operon repressor